MKRFICTWAIVAHTLFLFSQELFVEAESFKHKGGWVVDQQFMDMMGSPYLMAHGMGEAVDDAYTDVEFPEPGTYHAYVRTYNWTSPWSDHDGPGIRNGSPRWGAPEPRGTGNMPERYR